MSSMNNPTVAFLYSAEQPSDAQRQRLEAFLARTYPGQALTLEWKQDADLAGGFRMEVGADIYDWSLQGRMEQLRRKLDALDGQEDVLPLMRQAIQDWAPSTKPEEMGTVLTVGDEIATISGLEDAVYGEVLVFSNGIKGMVQELRPDQLCCVLFGDSSGIEAGDPVRRTRKVAGVPVGEGFLGRVVDALGSPIDGAGPILAIDALFPIGRGQRELIIGDRQTGKTAVALDTILNQKGKNVVCIYVAIGQKSSSVALLAENLRRRGAMDYCIIVSAPASDSASLQYIAPYAGTSILLERSPGREAYPGDVFYLHSRLLERSAHLSDEKGGGSMTALPIIETQAGDVSAYIPTNVISITDGQLFLESSLFFSGQRPAVNVGLSVSRVGGDAQTNKRQLTYGQGLMRLLRQKQYHPLTQHEQVITLVAALNHVLQDIPASQIGGAQQEMLAWFAEQDPALCQRIDSTGLLSDDDRQQILALARVFVAQYQKKGQ